MPVSIIIPTYNAEKYIEDMLQELHHVKSDHEIIIVDDGSKDSTVLIIKKYLEQHSDASIRLIQQENQGVSVARNNGIKEARGEFIVFCDVDDILYPEFMSALTEYRFNADVVMWRYSVLQDGNEFIPQKNVETEELSGKQIFTQYLYKECYIRMGSFAVKKQLLEDNNIVFTPDCKFAEDLEFIFKMLICSTKINYVNDVYYKYIKRNGSTIYSYNIRRFDAPLAIDRVIHFVENHINGEKMQAELSFLRGEFFLKQYFYSLDSCLQYLYINEYFSFLSEYTVLYSELDKRAQKVLRHVTFHRIDYSRNRIRLMKCSIRLYMIAMLLNNTVKGKKKDKQI